MIKKVAGTVFNSPKIKDAVNAATFGLGAAAASSPLVAPMTTQKVIKGAIDKVKSAVPSKKKEVQNNSYDPLANKGILEVSEKILKKNFDLGEEGYDIARDEGKVKPSKDKKDATTMPPSEEMKKTQKKSKGKSALELVKAKYKDSIMDTEKKKEEK